MYTSVIREFNYQNKKSSFPYRTSNCIENNILTKQNLGFLGIFFPKKKKNQTTKQTKTKKTTYTKKVFHAGLNSLGQSNKRCPKICLHKTFCQKPHFSLCFLYVVDCNHSLASKLRQVQVQYPDTTMTCSIEQRQNTFSSPFLQN